MFCNIVLEFPVHNESYNTDSVLICYKVLIIVPHQSLNFTFFFSTNVSVFFCVKTPKAPNNNYLQITSNNGSGNTGVGYRVAGGLSSGDNNTYIGYQAASNATTGNNNIVL